MRGLLLWQLPDGKGILTSSPRQRRVFTSQFKLVKTKWSYLQKNELIDIIAPGSAASLLDLDQGLQQLESWGFQTRVSQDLIKPHLYLANSDQERFKQFQKAMAAKDSKVVWCLRGGYGSIRLLPAIQKIKSLPKKLLVGISDVTSLHLYLNLKLDLVTLHAPLIDRIGQGKVAAKELKELKNLLTGQQKFVSYKMKPLNALAKKTKKLQGRVIGGNLVTMHSSVGHDWMKFKKDHILFIEELGERAYRIDRILQHMTQLGLFKNIKAVVIGQFLNCAEPDGKELWPQTLREWSEQVNIPVYHGLPCGHGQIQKPLFFNTKATIESGVLKVESGGVL